MSYQTGTATDIDDLLAKLSVFAQANGWTEDKIVAGSGNGASSELYLSKGIAFFQFQAQLSTGNNVYHGINQALDHPFLNMFGSTGFNGANPVGSQPGTNGIRVETNWLLPNFTAYHFFTDSAETYLHVVVEVIANEFRHFHVGILDKIGAYDGGQYVHGTSWDQGISFIDKPNNFQHGIPWTLIGNAVGRRQFLRVNIDGSDWKITQGITTTAWVPPFQHAAQGLPLEAFLEDNGSAFNVNCQPNSFNSTVILFPMPCHIIRSSTKRTPVGKPFDLRACNIRNVAPSSSIFFGGDEWLVFPEAQKNIPTDLNNITNSGFLAFAYLKVP